MADVKIMASGLGFPEGPVLCADGSVVLTEIRNRRCSRVTPDGKVSLFSDCGGGPNGLAIGPDGSSLLVADDVGDVVWRVTAASAGAARAALSSRP